MSRLNCLPLTLALVSGSVVAAPIEWRVPDESSLAWQGQVGAASAGNQQGAHMMYPASNMLGLLAAVLTHAALESTSQAAANNRERLAADAQLAPYAVALQGWTALALWEASTRHAFPLAALEGRDASRPADSTWLGTARLNYTVNASLGVVTLEMAGEIAPDVGAAPKKVMVRTVSATTPPDAARALWAADDAKVLKQIAVDLLAEALKLTASHETQPADTDMPFRTLRYQQGDNVVAERGQLLSDSCERRVMRTLRGNLLAVPQEASNQTRLCATKPMP
jgi:hypothetical protein